MTEIPKHLLRKAQEARDSRGGELPTPSNEVPEHLVERQNSRLENIRKVIRDHEKTKLTKLLEDLQNSEAIPASRATMRTFERSNSYQNTKRDGHRQNLLLLVDPISLVRKLNDPARKQRRKILKRIQEIISDPLKERQDLSFSDIDFLCQTTRFTELASDGDELVKSFLNGPTGIPYNRNEFAFWIELLGYRLHRNIYGHQVIKESFVRQEFRRRIIKELKKQDFKALKETFCSIPIEAEKRLHLYKDEKRLIEIQQVRNKIDYLTGIDLQEQIMSEVKAKQDQKRREIERGNLPQIRIEELDLPIPRFPSDHYDFEHICRDWLEAWGDSNAVVTQATGDSGIDVETDNFVAQSKFYTDRKVSRPELQQLAGAAQVSGKNTVFFAFNGYTNEALTYANQVGMALFNFNTNTIKFDPVNHAGNGLIVELAKLHLP